MGTAETFNRRVVFETGQEPEFVITRIVRWESAGNGMIRLYVASTRGTNERVEYSAVTSPTELAEMGRAALRIASEFHNLLVMLRGAAALN